MEIYFGYLGALCIGLILGLTGSGGSILTVPILVYLMHFNPITATAYSLFIVGTTSAFGTIQNFRKGIVEARTALYFAIPSFVAVFLTRKFIVPAIPDTLYQTAQFTLTKEIFMMVLFAILMFFASLSMLGKHSNEANVGKAYSAVVIALALMAVGVLIGIVGAGGGFLIVPALFFMGRLPIRKAIGSSLLIITLNSLIGFLGDLASTVIDWHFLIGFTALSVIGIFAGQYFSKYVNEQQLKKGFGWFVLLMALFIFTRELFFS